MIIGLGLDIVEIDRISSIYQKHGARFSQKILTKAEQQAISQQKAVYLASRFAAKEATVKALGTGFSQGIGFQDIEILNNNHGKPELHLKNKALEIFQQIGGKCLHLSITHSRFTAAAIVIVEG
ncbi:MAG: holo-ACP synthase [Desulfonauticus sp.]|nr:holo-ACP synthase [Desulfonauticus sp.]